MGKGLNIISPNRYTHGNEHTKRCSALVVVGEMMTDQSHNEAPLPCHSAGRVIGTGDETVGMWSLEPRGLLREVKMVDLLWKQADSYSEVKPC